VSIVRADQLIYTRVKASFSPAHYDGLQTVWKSSGLNAGKVREIERRIQCFRTDRQGDRRLQFFLLADGAAVVALSRSISSHPQIVGPYRDGLFAVHCLILCPADFARCHNDPFRVLDSCRLLDDLQTMVHAFGVATGTAPQVDIELQGPGPLKTLWDRGDASRLLELAIQAQALRESGSFVLLTGGQKEIEEALRLVFRIIPSRRRLSCCFDTAVEDVQLERGAFWAVGARSRLAGSQLVHVDSMVRRILAVPELKSAAEDLFAQYLRRSLERGGDLEDVAERSSAIEGLCRILEGEGDSEASTNRDAISDLVDTLPEGMKKKLFAAVSIRREMAAAKPLAELSVEWILKTQPHLKRKERILLQSLAREAVNPLLLFLASVSGKDGRGREEALRSMSGEDFQSALSKTSGCVVLENFVHPFHIASLLREIRPESLNEDELAGLMRAVASIDGGMHLGAFASSVDRIKPDGLRRLAKAIRRLSKVNPEFRRRITERSQNLKSRRTGVLPWAF
jgi:hypothetical protein